MSDNKWTATHEVRFRPVRGKMERHRVMLMDDGAAFTKDEWEGEYGPSLGLSGGEWFFANGNVTPEGRSGTVDIVRLPKAAAKRNAGKPVAIVVAGKQVVATGTAKSDLPELRKIAKQAGGEVYCAGGVKRNAGDVVEVTIQGEPRDWRIYVGDENQPSDTATSLAEAKRRAATIAKYIGGTVVLLGRAGWATPSGHLPGHGR